MTPDDLWTVERLNPLARFGIQHENWTIVAPRNTPDAEPVVGFVSNPFAPTHEGRNAYGFATEESARSAAARENDLLAAGGHDTGADR